MKAFRLIIIILLIGQSSIAQVTFKPGYYIKDDGTRTEGFIKDQDRKNNPNGFEFKNSENSTSTTIPINEITEFGAESFKYVRYEGPIDQSRSFSAQQEPEWKTETVLLKVLVEGESSLYAYEKGGLRRYFFKVPNQDITQLVYKKYKFPGGQVAENNRFRSQLGSNVKCKAEVNNGFGKIEYKKSDLIKYFVGNNECRGSSFKVYSDPKDQALFNLKLTPGINFSSLDILDKSNNILTQIDNEANFRIGMELEYIMPFNKEKWSLFIEPTFHNFNLNGSNLKVDYQSIEIPIGIRHYIYLNKDLKLFANGAIVFDYNNNKTISTETTEEPLAIENRINFAVGTGIDYKRFKTEIRYNTQRDLLANQFFWASEYTSISIILGVKILQ